MAIEPLSNRIQPIPVPKPALIEWLGRLGKLVKTVVIEVLLICFTLVMFLISALILLVVKLLQPWRRPRGN